MRCKAAWWYSAALAAVGSLHLILYVRYVHTRIVRGVRRKLFVMYAYLATSANLNSFRSVRYRDKADEIVLQLQDEVLEGFIVADMAMFESDFWVLALSNESANRYALLKDKADNVFQGFGNKPFDVVVPGPKDILYGRTTAEPLYDLALEDKVVVLIYEDHRRKNSLAQFKNFVRDFRELDDPEFFEWYSLREYVIDGYKSESERDAWIQGRYAEMSYKKEVRRRANEEYLRQEKLAAEKAARAEEACAQAREKVRFIAASRSAAKAAREAEIAQAILNFREEIEALEAVRLQWSLQAPSEMEAAAAEVEAELDEQFARHLDFVSEANNLAEVLAESPEPAPVQEILGSLNFCWVHFAIMLCALISTIAYVVM